MSTSDEQSHPLSLLAQAGLLKSKDTDQAVNSISSQDPVNKTVKFCRCKNSKCLKLYCICFASGSICSSSCLCQSCRNQDASNSLRKQAIDSVLGRNSGNMDQGLVADRSQLQSTPSAETSLMEVSQTVAAPSASKSPSESTSLKVTVVAVTQKNGQKSLKQYKGCNCRKSRCLKKYCECFLKGVFCSSNCNCCDCVNFAGNWVSASCNSADFSEGKSCQSNVNLKAPISDSVKAPPNNLKRTREGDSLLSKGRDEIDFASSLIGFGNAVLRERSDNTSMKVDAKSSNSKKTQNSPVRSIMTGCHPQDIELQSLICDDEDMDDIVFSHNMETSSIHFAKSPIVKATIAFQKRK